MDIPEKVKKLWGAWDVRIFILLSLLSQISLVLFAPLRKKNRQKKITVVIWLAYLIADWIAVFTLGLLPNSLDDSSSTGGRDELAALWAPFLLLHLGGPDAITAFALEDNELWRRHLISLLSQLIPAGYVLLRSFPGNKLLIPTIFVFVDGIIKYAERTWALYRGSLDVFTECILPDPDPGPNYIKLMEEYSSGGNSGRTLEVEPETNNIVFEGCDSMEIDCRAYEFFHTLKILIVGLPLTFHQMKNSQVYFVKRSANDAFRMIEIELSLVYEVFYTKAFVVHSRIGYVLRFICFCSIIIAFFLFLSLEKPGYQKFDIGITYILLIGAISLETIGLFNLIFSDWSIIALRHHTSTASFLARFREGPRWSQYVPQLNLISFCLGKRQKWVEIITYILCFKNMLDEIQFKNCEPVTDKLKKIIFNELKKKSILAVTSDIVKELVSSRGEWVLKRSPAGGESLSWSVKVDFDESVLLWHIATEICYDHRSESHGEDERRICKVLSDYMVYLMVMQPTMMSTTMGIWKIRYRDTCAEAKECFQEMNLGLNHPPGHLCDMLIRICTGLRSSELKGGTSKSVFFDAVMLAKDLLKLKERWSIMINVWVEMLCYAASHCRAYVHAQQLSRGGELLTFVWLLMVQLGLGDCYLEEPGRKLIRRPSQIH